MPTNDNLAFVFPGQGSQKIGMLADIAAQYSEVRHTFAEAGDVLGYDAWDLIQNGTQENINLTERTQPLLLTASVALWRIWQAKKTELPAFLAGHSLGEWSALVCAGVISFADAVKLVQFRGIYMQEAVPVGQGAMAAVLGLEDMAIEQCCQQAAQGEEVAAVNFNAPGQVVIAGLKPAVSRAMELCEKAGAKRTMLLPVSAPFHTNMMKPAAEKLARDINLVAFSQPKIPLVQNVHGRIETNPAVIRDLIIEQIYKAVRWVDCVQMLVSQGVNTVVECGPGKVLCGLNKRIAPDLQLLSTDNLKNLNETLMAG